MYVQYVYLKCIEHFGIYILMGKKYLLGIEEVSIIAAIFSSKLTLFRSFICPWDDSSGK
jgi:hypothetical protein